MDFNCATSSDERGFAAEYEMALFYEKRMQYLEIRANRVAKTC
jgi:hypothetical protein